MITTNPYTGEPEKAELFEPEYLAGFQDPTNLTVLFHCPGWMVTSAHHQEVV
jgi:hypothetical protein